MIALQDVPEGHIGPKLRQGDGKVNPVHQAVQHRSETALTLRRPHQAYPVARNIDRREERQAVEMIPVRMSNEDPSIESAALAGEQVNR